VKVRSKDVAAIAGLDEAYRLLGSGDASQAARGQDYLYRNAADGVKMLSEKLVVPGATPADKVSRLIADLGNEDYQTRRAAVNGLIGIGGEASDAVRHAAEKSPNPEVRKLAEEALAKMEATPTGPDDLRAIRAVEVLEHLARSEPANAEARELLKKWSAGPRGHRTTVEAAAALARIAPPKP
jgi:HEAT repeat protein